MKEENMDSYADECYSCICCCHVFPLKRYRCDKYAIFYLKSLEEKYSYTKY